MFKKQNSQIVVLNQMSQGAMSLDDLAKTDDRISEKFQN